MEQKMKPECQRIWQTRLVVINFTSEKKRRKNPTIASYILYCKNTVKKTTSSDSKNEVNSQADCGLKIATNWAAATWSNRQNARVLFSFNSHEFNSLNSSWYFFRNRDHLLLNILTKRDKQKATTRQLSCTLKQIEFNDRTFQKKER